MLGGGVDALGAKKRSKHQYVRILIEIKVKLVREEKAIDPSMDEVLTAADVSSTSSAAGLSPLPLSTNFPFVSALLAFSIAQFLKLFTTWCVPSSPLLDLRSSHLQTLVLNILAIYRWTDQSS